MNSSKMTIENYLGYDDIHDMKGKACLVVKEDQVIYGMLSVFEGQLYICNDSRELNGKGLDNQYNFGFPNAWVLDPNVKLHNCSGNPSITSDGVQSIAIIEYSSLPEEIRTKYGRPTVKLNDTHTAQIHVGYVQVGCQRINNEAVIELYKSLMDNGK